MSEPPAELPIKVGDILASKYRVERVLGAGGMGMVVAARHLDLDELRAIKLMLPSASGSQLRVERFLREARAAVALKDEHIVQIHDVGRLESGAPYMVMEYLDGQDLEVLLEERGSPLPANVVVDYVLQALEALAKAHDSGIIHRDLKPANLFLTRDKDGEPCIKVLDFGISKLTGEAATGQGLDMTKTSTMLGSPFYMSPEQMRSARNVDARTDIWSLGVIMYQLLTCERPFPGDSITEICAGVLQDQPAPLRRHRPDLPAQLEAAVMRCLAKNPAQRCQSVAELARALAPFGTPATQRSVVRIARTTGDDGVLSVAALAAQPPPSVPRPALSPPSVPRPALSPPSVPRPALSPPSVPRPGQPVSYPPTTLRSPEVSTDSRSLEVSTDGLPLVASSDSRSLEVSTDGQSLEVSTDGRSLEVSTDGLPLAVSSDGRPLAVSSDGRPLAVSTDGRPLTASSDSRPLPDAAGGLPDLAESPAITRASWGHTQGSGESLGTSRKTVVLMLAALGAVGVVAAVLLATSSSSETGDRATTGPSAEAVSTGAAAGSAPAGSAAASAGAAASASATAAASASASSTTTTTYKKPRVIKLPEPKSTTDAFGDPRKNRY